MCFTLMVLLRLTLTVSTATKRQRFQMKTFFLDRIMIVTVVPHNLLSDEGLIFFYGAEVVTAPQYQRLTDTPFQMPVGTFNRAIFVAPTGIIMYALHSVVLTDSSITLSQLAASISAQLSEGFLQTFSQSREALTTQHNPHPAPVAPFQTEVIQLTDDGDNYTFQFSKVRQASQTGLMSLAEHDLLLCTIL